MTFSIVARDPETGAIGVATATAGPMVGALVPHVRSGIGAAATQAMTNPYLALDALLALAHHGPEEALAEALERDAQAGLRQVIIINSGGQTAAWTGEQCIPFAGQLSEAGVAVAGNMLAGPQVLTSMMAAYLLHVQEGSGLAHALLHALLAGARAGGDSRGIGSAALRVHSNQAFADVDLRVDWSEDPLNALEDLLNLACDGPYADFFAGVPRRNE